MEDGYRKFTRIKYGVPAVITVESTVFSVEAVINLSIGGALIPCEQIFDELTRCIFQIPITGTTANLCVEASGEFVWSNATQAAIKFTDISPESLMLLQNIIRYNAEDADKIESEIASHCGLK